MKKLSVFLFVCLLTFFFTACGQEVVSSPESSISPTSSLSEPSELESNFSDSTPTEGKAAEGIEAGTGCGSTLKEKYSFHYYNVDGSLIDFIGADTFDAWWKKNKGQDLSILNVVRDFQIPKETFLSVTRPELDEETLEQLRSQGITLEEWYPYTLEEIDAIYSGEEATVNRVFCSPIAVFNEKDSQIYTLRWLASHTAEEYQSVGLSSQAIQEVLNRIQSDDEYAEWRTVAKQVEPILEKAESIETAASKKLVE